jgi:cell division protein FtsQ
MKYFNWINIRLILMIVVVIFLYSFTSNRNSTRKIRKIVITILDEDAPLINQELVNQLLMEKHKQLTSIHKDKLSLIQLEKKLDNYPLIDKAEVFITVDGALKALVKQKVPIARFFNKNKSFYLDYKGHVMPLSLNFTARVPIVTGVLDKKNKEELTDLFRIIYDDAFFRKNIIGVQIMNNGSLKMINRNYDFVIDLGGPGRMNAKLNNYKVFFQKTALDKTLEKYKIIDLRFTRQVVCTKK